MALRQKRRLQKPGPPEFIALVFLAGVLAPAIALMDILTAPRLETAPGRVVSCEVHLTHYNATGDLPKVFMTYTYQVGLAQYTNTWEGFWPSASGPNALPPDQLDKLKQPGYALTVFYNPARPEKSLLHERAGFGLIYSIATLVTTLLAGVYFLRVYPHWKRARI